MNCQCILPFELDFCHIAWLSIPGDPVGLHRRFDLHTDDVFLDTNAFLQTIGSPSGPNQAWVGLATRKIMGHKESETIVYACICHRCSNSSTKNKSPHTCPGSCGDEQSPKATRTSLTVTLCGAASLLLWKACWWLMGDHTTGLQCADNETAAQNGGLALVLNPSRETYLFKITKLTGMVSECCCRMDSFFF